MSEHCQVFIMYKVESYTHTCFIPPPPPSSPFYTSNILSKLNSKRRQFLYCHCGQGIFSGCFVAGIDVQVFFEIINMQILRIHAFKIDFVDLY